MDFTNGDNSAHLLKVKGIHDVELSCNKTLRILTEKMEIEKEAEFLPSPHFCTT